MPLIISINWTDLSILWLGTHVVYFVPRCHSANLSHEVFILWFWLHNSILLDCNDFNCSWSFLSCLFGPQCPLSLSPYSFLSLLLLPSLPCFIHKLISWCSSVKVTYFASCNTVQGSHVHHGCSGLFRVLLYFLVLLWTHLFIILGDILQGHVPLTDSLPCLPFCRSHDSTFCASICSASPPLL